jgi:hypothetical protein
MTIIDQIARDHDNALYLIGGLRRVARLGGDAGSCERAREVLVQLAELLQRHARLSGALKARVLDARQERQESRGARANASLEPRRLVGQVTALGARTEHCGDAAWMADVAALEDAVKQHVADETSRLVAEARRLFDEGTLEAMLYEAERHRAHQSEEDALIHSPIVSA